MWEIGLGWVRLVAKKMILQIIFGKGTMKEQMIDIFIPITANALLVSLPIFLVEGVFG
jgi:hypothetical protein